MASKKPLAVYSGVQKEIPTSDTTEVGSLSVATAVYLRGDDSTNGSVRISSPSDNTLLFETRVAGSWVSIGTFTPI